jgi:hypothetical protein
LVSFIDNIYSFWVFGYITDSSKLRIFFAEQSVFVNPAFSKKITLMTAIFSVICGKYDENQDLENDFKDKHGPLNKHVFFSENMFSFLS